MDIETRRRIRAYKKALPELRERVIAVALLLAMSASMLTSASFAWLTISRRPEVTGVSTTVAANGNLEIALATSEDHPDESKVGDSSAAQGQSVTAANITWGNLVNLSDPSYGLENLVMRPAQLNKESLLTSPLFGAVYTEDGRVERLTSNFSYTSWIPPEGTTPGYFGIANKLGVRAISSTKVEAQGFMGTVMAMKDTATSSNAAAVGKYLSITQESAWMTALANMMGIHMTANLNSEDKYKNAEVSSTELQALIDMYGAFIEAFDLEAIAMADILNLQLFLAWGGDTTKYNTYNAAAIMALNPNSGSDYVINANGKSVRLTNLKAFKDDYKMLVENKAKMIEIRDQGDRRWTASGLSAIVNKLVNINACKIQFSGENPQTVQNFLNSMSGSQIISAGMKYNNAECTAYITNGVLYNFDQRVGAGIRVTQNNSGTSKKGLPITAKVYVSRLSYEASAKIYATIETETTSPSDFAKDLAYADSLNTGAGENVGEMSAKDTYGLAIDLWVRTNADNSFLTLEGNVLTKEEEIDAMGKDANGNDVQLYSLARTGTDPETGEMMLSDYTLYKVEIEVPNEETQTMDKVDVWYNANDFSVFSLQEGETPTKKKETLITVVGYEGENRIWNSDEDKVLLSTDATTQGSGSCYVYYADTPEDQARSLELLKAMHVAFINTDGKLLATATMDADYSYEESGRVIVPLVLDGNSIQVGDEENPVLAITKLDKNVPTRITAIVYLDGTALTNDNVLAAAEIQGQLNIQFGTNLDMDPIRNETLEQAERKVSATVSRTEFNYDTDPDLTTRVSVTVDGEQPENVTAFFIRKINETQGSREPVMTNFVQNAEGVWECDHTFKAPGVYILRSVELDGQEYPLPYSQENPLPTVTIKGFTVQSLTCTQAINNRINVFTKNNSSTVDLQLKFAADDQSKMPTTVQGRFLKTDGTAVNVNFTYNPSGPHAGFWTGSATFLASGEYTLQFLLLNGQYTELPEHFWQTAHMELGMTVEVYTKGNTDFKYLESEMEDNEKVLPMEVRILDNGGNEKVGLQGAWLTYVLTTSSASKMRTELTWDPVKHLYTGELLTLESGGPGTWIFKNVTLANDDELTYASISPTFIMRAPEPPSLYTEQPVPVLNSYNYAPDGGAFMEVNLNYSSTATVQAIIADASGKEYPVQGELAGEYTTNVSRWKFTIPDNASGTYSGTQNGWWTLKSINVWNYIDANGNFIKAEVYEEDPNKGLLVPDGKRDDPLVINMLGKVDGKDYKVKVVETFTLSFAGNTNKEFDGEFLQEHTVSGIYFDLYDFEGKKLNNVTDMSLVYAYDGDSKNHGGYTNEKIVAKNPAFTVTFATDSEGVRFTQQQAQNLRLAGVYSPYSFTYTVAGKEYKYTTANMPAFVPKITVDSEAPEVWISAITPEKDKVITVDAGNVPVANNHTISDTKNSTQGAQNGETGGCNSKPKYDWTWQCVTNADHTPNTYAPSITNNGLTATLYFPCTHPLDPGEEYDGGTSNGATDNRGEPSNMHYHDYVYNGGNGVPSATLKVSGLGSASSAKLTFTPKTTGATVYLFPQYRKDSGADTYWAEKSQRVDYYEWTRAADGWTDAASSCHRFVGGMDNNSTDDTRYVAGTLTANTLVVTCDLDGDGINETVNFTIPTITINNPY